MGIAWAMLAPPISFPSLYFFAILGSTLAFISLQKYLPVNKTKLFSGFWIFGAMLFLGLYLTTAKLASYKANHFEDSSYIEAFEGRIMEQPVEKNKTVKAIIEVVAIKDTTNWTAKNGKIIVYLEKTDRALNLKTGSSIVFKGYPAKVVNAGNPGEFDYAGYLARKGIFHQLYISNSSWISVADPAPFSLQTSAERIRESVLINMKGNGIEGENFDVASAILLGYDDMIDPETRKAYAGTGAMHILSVSGLHVGIIYTLLSYMLVFLTKKKNGPIVKALILITIIWLYAFITGLAPATVRSAAMFTFVSVGSVFGRKTPMYNTLAASALFILIVNPLLIADIGFQLSYMAVVGIVAIQPGLSALLPLKHKIALYVRDLLSVSVAAQIATLPITLFYFNQFPNYFLLTNLIIIPWSFLVMVVGMVFVLASPIHGVAFYFGKLLSYLVFGMNWAIKAIESLPYSVSDGIIINIFEMLLIGLIIVLLVVFFYSKRKNLFIASIMIACILVASTIKGTYYKSRQQAIVLCNYNKINCLALVNGQTMKVITDSLPTDENLKNLQQELGIKKMDIELLKAKTPLSRRFIWFNNQKIVILDDSLSRFKPHKAYKADIVIITSRKLLPQKILERHYPAKTYLIGSGLSAAKTQQWLQRLTSQNAIDIKKTGCFYSKY